MGQKVNPEALRLGINRTWRSQWFPKTKGDYAKWLKEDIVIRREVMKRLPTMNISEVIIKRTVNGLNVEIRTSQEGEVLGREGKNIEKLLYHIRRTLGNRKLKIKFSVVPIDTSIANAQLLANKIAYSIENRMPFRIVQKKAIREAMGNGAKGVKTLVAGRLGGADIARSEGYSEGSVPLHTLKSRIDYATATAKTTYGQIGVKVWISHGNYGNRNTRRPPNRRRRRHVPTQEN